MKKFISTMLCVLFGMTMMVAQNTTVHGVVTSSEDGEPVVGASVMVEGTQQGTVTGMDGRFVLSNVPVTARNLVISYIGMETQTAAIKPQMTVMLKSNSESLDEVMVVAYGTTKKSSFSGSASQVNGDKLQKLLVSDLSKGLDGSTAGVQTVSSSGSPGTAAKILIRGIGSISSSQQPLIVVDGVPYEGSLNSIATQDIDALTILKDAAANSMYGARGSNGVIIITTKGSKAGKPKINFEARLGFNKRGVPYYDVVTDPGEYYELMYEAYRNTLTPEMGYEAASQAAASGLITNLLKYNKFKGIADDKVIDPLTGKLNANAKEYLYDDDWQKDPFTTGVRQEYNVNVSGGNDFTKAYFSLGYLDEKGYVKNSGFDRVSGRLKIDQKINDFIKTGANVSYSRTNRRSCSTEEAAYSNIFYFTQMVAPIYPIYMYDSNGNRVKDDNGNDKYDYGLEKGRPFCLTGNAVGDVNININRVKSDNISSRAFLEADITKDLKFTANIAYDVFMQSDDNLKSPLSGDGQGTNGDGSKSTNRYAALNLNQLLNYTHTFGSKHNVNVLLGHETKRDTNTYMYGRMFNYAISDNVDFANAANIKDLTSYSARYSLEGYFSRADYNYDNKYFVTASIRRDGSSKFYKDNRWGTFWALGGSWNMTNEEFMKGIKDITFLKLKASFGTQGNDNLLDNGYTIYKAYSDLYTVNRVNNEVALSKTFRGNKDLTWEKSNNFNIGFESRLFNRVNLNFDFFIKETKDMLYASPLVPSEGTPTFIYKNEMDMKNTGFEVSVDVDILKTPQYTWNAGINITHYKNELTKLPSSKPASEFPDGYQAGYYWRKLGGSLYDWYLYDYVGVDEATGLPIYNNYTKNDDGTTTVTQVNSYTLASYHETGKSAIPDITGGFSTSFEGYGFDLSIQTAFQLGGYVYDQYYENLINCRSDGYGLHKDIYKRWTPNNTKTSIPALTFGPDYGTYGTASLKSASYFSLRNVTLGYTLPKSIIKSCKMESVRFYVNGDNLWLKSARKGLDPRQQFNGSTGFTYSAMKTISFGVNVGF